MPVRQFNKGDKVEVARDDEISKGCWFPATVIRSAPARHRDQIFVEYETLISDDNETKCLKEFVNVANVRPLPPLELLRYFKVGDTVDAYHRNGWRKGTVLEILENSKYVLTFDGGNERKEVEQWCLRFHHDWDDGSWIPPIKHQKKSTELEVKSRGVKLRIKCSGRTSEVKFSKGTVVEIKSDEEGYRGSWYTAVIVDSIGNNKFWVEYQTLKTDDETQLLKEKAHVSCIRPCPPDIQRVDHYEQLEEVDAWYNDGWWMGSISKVLDGLKYIVYFSNTNEEMVLEHSKLRPHQEWIDNKWVPAPRRRSSELELKSRVLKLKIKCSGRGSAKKFSEGTIVEIRSDEEGYQGSWYTATIVGSIGNDKFLVEYQMLKTDDESKLLRETIDASYIRPCPPEILRVDRFKLLEEIDAWYNDGWWVGLIARVLDGLKYRVYFWTTNEELEFGHFNLRPHQEWIGGKWVIAFMERKSCFLQPKSILGRLQRQYSGKRSESMFCIGTKVEVKTDEEVNWSSWYPAVILSSMWKGKHLVEFQTLKNDDETGLLKQEIDALCIRHYPPVVQRSDRFKPVEEVDAWYNYGWWVGHVCRVLEGSKYTVYVRSTNMELEFQHSNLRPHQEWTDGKWIITSRGRNL